MSQMIDIIQRVVRQELARSRTSLLGVVTAVFPHEAADDQNNYEASVQLKYEELELRNVPIAVDHVGLAVPPRVGDLVLVQFIGGDLNQPVISGRFYHADDRPPLHKADEVMFEHRVSDDTINQLRFAADGAIYLQRKITKPEDNSAAEATIAIAANGTITILSGKNIAITLTKDDTIEITADGLPINIKCDMLTLDGDMTVNKNAVIKGELKVGGPGGSTTIKGNEITGGM
ncbi:MAG TPA: phage baseplate assembly protein V [Herpetosiphonaceae bacterium]